LTQNVDKYSMEDTKPSRRGRPPGAKNRVRSISDRVFFKDFKKVSQKVVQMAAAGDMTAAKLIFDRCAPAPKGRLVTFELPPINTAADGEAALGAILAACGAGKLTPDEAKTLSDIVHRKVEVVHMRAVEERLDRLEQAPPRTIESYRKVANA
jgi:hypothetical protein